MYLTPKRLRYMGLGIDLSGKKDYELAEQIRTATALVDAYCNVPTYPSPYSFKGGSVTNEQHSWHDQRARRVYLFHTPIKALSRFQIKATESLYIDFPEANDYFINHLEGYVEIINFALTKIGIWGQANVPQMGLIDPVAETDYTYGYAFPFSDEPIYAIPNPSGEDDYATYMAPDGFWDPDGTVTVKVNGAEQASGYTLDRDGGFVAFDPALDADASVSLSYTARIPRDVSRATAIGAISLLGEARLAAVNMTGVESIKAEELEIRRIGSRSGAEKGLELPAQAKLLLEGYRFWTVR